MNHLVRAQFIRFVLIGLGINATLYLAYLLLTWWIVGSETAMTITFGVGVLLSFLANRSLTFRHRGDGRAALLRFSTCYAILYVLNFIALWGFAGRMGLPHQIVQGCMVLVLALLAFTMQKYWVFPESAGSGGWIATRITR
jgi:putative flippase GtrA